MSSYQQNALSASDMLSRRSVLRPTQLELMGDDVDLTTFYLWFSGTNFNIVQALETIEVDRTIEGASTITVTVADHDRSLLRSGKLSARQDIEIDGLWFRLVETQITGPGILELTFEDREIAILRLFNTPIKASSATSRTKITRAQFIARLINEALPTTPMIIPELSTPLPVGKLPAKVLANVKQVNKQPGIPATNSLMVKTGHMTEAQRSVAEIILDTGTQRSESREAMVIAIMVAIQESDLTNLIGGDSDTPVGVFQQIQKDGWPASRDVIKDSTAFYEHLDKLLPSSEQYYQLAEAVQHSGQPTLYAQWRTQAERIVTTYGVPGGTIDQVNGSKPSSVGAGSADYEFYRGIPPTTQHAAWKAESSWDCIQRLASEVNMRAYFVSGTFYYISDADLFNTLPVATLDESSEGVVQIISADYDEGKNNGEMQFDVQMELWACPPGSVVQIQNMGPWDGRWLCNEVTRTLSIPQGEITLKKPLPRLPEPVGTNISSTDVNGPYASTFDGVNVFAPPTQKTYTADMLIQPIPLNMSNRIDGANHSTDHPTEGLAGYEASDFYANYKTPVLAIESGTIVKWSGHDPSISPLLILGAHGPYAWSMYLLGDSGTEYYYTHLYSRLVPVGQKVKIGQQIATVANYSLYGTPSHTHVGVHPGSSGHPDIDDVVAAPQILFKKV